MKLKSYNVYTQLLRKTYSILAKINNKNYTLYNKKIMIVQLPRKTRQFHFGTHSIAIKSSVQKMHNKIINYQMNKNTNQMQIMQIKYYQN